MSDKEISFNDDLQTYEPCTNCLDIAMDAAYSNGFLTEDDEYVVINDFDIGDASDIVPNSNTTWSIE